MSQFKFSKKQHKKWQIPIISDRGMSLCTLTIVKENENIVWYETDELLKFTQLHSIAVRGIMLEMRGKKLMWAPKEAIELVSSPQELIYKKIEMDLQL